MGSADRSSASSLKDGSGLHQTVAPVPHQRPSRTRPSTASQPLRNRPGSEPDRPVDLHQNVRTASDCGQEGSAMSTGFWLSDQAWAAIALPRRETSLPSAASWAASPGPAMSTCVARCVRLRHHDALRAFDMAEIMGGAGCPPLWRKTRLDRPGPAPRGDPSPNVGLMTPIFGPT